jgi:hypothetical protein
MANGIGTGMPPLSPAGAALNLGDLLRGQVSDETEELKKRRQAQLAGRPDLGMGGVGYAGSLVGGPLNGFGRPLR